jgi:HEAT repeat protein
MRVMMVVTLASLLPVAGAVADAPRRERRADTDMIEALATLGAVIDAALRPAERGQDVPRLLADALRTGTADTAAIGAIMRWVQEAKEEEVAAGFAEVLRALDATAKGPEAARWNASARTVIAVFEGLLRDAQVNRRRDGREVRQDLQPVVRAAVPALVEGLRAADPVRRDQFLRALRALAPAAGDLVTPLRALLDDEDPAMRLGAATALGALGTAAGPARDDLETALGDVDGSVREAAAAALKQIQPDLQPDSKP